MSSTNNFKGATSGEPYEKIGLYYNWYAATAGTGVYSTEDFVSPDSICPKGWHLPSWSNGQQYRTLGTTYGLVDGSPADQYTLFMYPLNLLPAGYYRMAWINRVGTINSGDNEGWQRYWYGERKWKGNLFAEMQNGKLGLLSATDGDSRGLSIRCVAY